jgi:hypothetical protein
MGELRADGANPALRRNHFHPLIQRGVGNMKRLMETFPVLA